MRRAMGSISMLGQDAAKQLDVDLMDPNKYGFTLDQLMELAGLSVACALTAAFPLREFGRRVLAVCGPGNNGGDGLVAARHLFHFGYEPIVVYPKRSEQYGHLVKQIEVLGIEVKDVYPDHDEYDIVLDGVFGFSFDPSRGFREPFGKIMDRLTKEKQKPVVSIDIPSGWHVEEGGDSWSPDVLVSLTAPKKCAAKFQGRHFLGGRFLPPSLAEEYGLTNLPTYPGSEQCVEITEASCDEGSKI